MVAIWFVGVLTIGVLLRRTRGWAGAALMIGGASTLRPAPMTEAAACPRADEPKYLGSKSCQKCHFKEYASWQKTKMAQAFTTLKPNQAVEARKKAKLDPAKDYTKEAGCVVCHSSRISAGGDTWKRIPSGSGTRQSGPP